MLNRINDYRYKALKSGVDQLNNEQITRIIQFNNDGNEILCDTLNYDSRNNLWCALAVGLNLHMEYSNDKNVSDLYIKSKIVEKGKKQFKEFSLNSISGVPGVFYTENRQKDLIQTCQDILQERNSLSAISY